ncbi:MAG: phage major capsid protein [Acidimicrobiales bacterium]
MVTGRPEYRTGWLKLASGQEWALTAEEQAAVVEARAASLTDASGGFAVPYSLDPTLIVANDGTANPWRQVARVVTLTGSDEWRGVSTAGITASWDTEATEVSDDAPTLAQPTITPQKASAFVPFSIEVGADWTGMEAELREAFADARDRLEATAFATGAGTGGVPQGIITAVVAGGTSVVATASADTFAATDVYALQAAVPPRFRSNGVWVANLAIYNRARQFTDTVGGFRNSLDMSTGMGPTMLGRPVHESSDMDGVIDAAANNYILLFGDVRAAYTIVDRVGLSVELVPHLVGTNHRPTGQRGLYAYWRVGGGLVNGAAVRLLNA